jgi:starch synthase (maltosyl-transferring)
MVTSAGRFDPVCQNPPKKYQDIYPSISNPTTGSALGRIEKHYRILAEQLFVFSEWTILTKSFPFWRGDPQKKLSTPFFWRAFTRPKVMYRLAKLGFSQSYVLRWRNTKAELTEYFTELTRTEVADFSSQSLAQHAGYFDRIFAIRRPPGVMARLVLAATLGASYGIYGPAFELCENVARDPGSEEYLNSEVRN